MMLQLLVIPLFIVDELLYRFDIRAWHGAPDDLVHDAFHLLLGEGPALQQDLAQRQRLLPGQVLPVPLQHIAAGLPVIDHALGKAALLLPAEEDPQRIQIALNAAHIHAVAFGFFLFRDLLAIEKTQIHLQNPIIFAGTVGSIHTDRPFLSFSYIIAFFRPCASA